MSLCKHTPGPWDFDGPIHSIVVWSRQENRVCFLTSDGPAEANARLIAAAPDLLEALRSFMHYGCPVCGGDCASANPPVMSCPVQAGYAAIAKAEGRS